MCGSQFRGCWMCIKALLDHVRSIWQRTSARALRALASSSCEAMCNMLHVTKLLADGSGFRAPGTNDSYSRLLLIIDGGDEDAPSCLPCNLEV